MPETKPTWEEPFCNVCIKLAYNNNNNNNNVVEFNLEILGKVCTT